MGWQWSRLVGRKVMESCWGLVHWVDTKEMGNVVRENGLGEVNREVLAGTSFPGEGRVDEVVDLAHEVDRDPSSQLLFEARFFGAVCRVENKIVYVHANIDCRSFQGGKCSVGGIRLPG